MQYGKTYKLHLENFPASASLKVDLVKFHVRSFSHVLDSKVGMHVWRQATATTTVCVVVPYVCICD